VKFAEKKMQKGTMKIMTGQKMSYGCAEDIMRGFTLAGFLCGHNGNRKRFAGN